MDVETVPVPAGERVELDRVLMVADDSGVRVGTPVVDDAKVICRVLAHGRGPRVRVFKYKPKSNYRRLQGHRQRLTRLVVERIETGAQATEN